MEVIERIAEHYEAQEVPYGRVYEWCPEHVVIQCACGKRSTQKRADIISLVVTACACGKDEMAGIREELIFQLLDEEYEAHRHPWRYWHTTKDSGVPF